MYPKKRKRGGCQIRKIQTSWVGSFMYITWHLSPQSTFLNALCFMWATWLSSAICKQIPSLFTFSVPAFSPSKNLQSPPPLPVIGKDSLPPSSPHPCRPPETLPSPLPAQIPASLLEVELRGQFPDLGTHPISGLVYVYRSAFVLYWETYAHRKNVSHLEDSWSW